jgi:hypothetical protein
MTLLLEEPGERLEEPRFVVDQYDAGHSSFRFAAGRLCAF